MLPKTIHVIMLLLLVLVRSEDGTHSDANTWNDHMEADTRAWCSSVQSTPEPSLVFYNRIPKCGSSTMQGLFRKIAHYQHSTKSNSSHLKNVKAASTTRPLWSNQPSPQLQQDLYQFVNSQFTSSKNNLLVFDGHISFFPFNTSSIRLNSQVTNALEFTNVIRQCESRQQSGFFYTLYESVGARKAERKKQTSSYLLETLGLDKSENLTQCLRNESCLLKSNKLNPSSKARIISTFMGDCSRKGGCSERQSQQQKKEEQKGKNGKEINIEMVTQREVASVLNNVKANSGVYKTFGLIEYLTQYLEMLECVYPSMRGIVQVLNTSHKANSHSDVFRHPETTRITNKVFAEQCHDSPDSRLYTLMNTTFWRRYHALKSQRGRCCRGHGQTMGSKNKNNKIL